MDEDFFALTAAERGVLAALNRHGIRYMLVGLGAAALQGANTATEDIDIWFENTADPRIGDAINGIGGVWISGSFGMMQPQIGGAAIGNRLDVVTHMSGLGKFADEAANATLLELDGVPVMVLKLDTSSYAVEQGKIATSSKRSKETYEPTCGE